MKVLFDPTYQKYPSQRYPISARGGMVNCSSPQAAAAGLEALRGGGNAMDAAVAAAAALTVVEPTANGIGSDAFALVWSEKDQKLFGLNSSGPAPMEATVERILADHKDVDGAMPTYGWGPVTVSGAPKAWAELTSRFGRRTLAENVAPAVRYAREGYPCAPNLAVMWKRAFEKFKTTCTGEEFDEWYKTFTPEGRAYEAGDLIRLPRHADTLEEIGATNAASFYSGDLARKIDASSRKHGGYLRYEDLAAYEAKWVEPISVDYRGYQVCEIPPNGQGIVALMALNILKEFDFREKDCVETYHRQLEAMKMAFADAFHYVTDPDFMELDYHRLLDPAYGAQRAGEMGETPRSTPTPCPPRAAPSTSAAPTARATWSPISSPTTWASAPAWWWRAPASPSRTGDTTSPSRRGMPTCSGPASGATTPSSPASSCRAAGRWAPSASWAVTCSPRDTSR